MEGSNPGNVQENQFGSYKQSSIFIAVMVICFSVCLMWVRLLMKWNFVFHYYPCTICMILSAVGLVTAMNYYTYIEKRPTVLPSLSTNDTGDRQHLIENDRSDNGVRMVNGASQQNGRHMLQTLYYLVYVVYLFAVGNFLLDLSAILTIVHCSKSKYDLEYTSLVVFHISRLVFVGLQLLFFQEMVPIVLKPHKLVKYLIAFVIGTNVSNWFTLYLQLGILELKSEKTSFEYRYINCTFAGKSNTIHKIAKAIDENTNPFNLEFSMMSVVLLFHIYPQELTSAPNEANDEDETNRPDELNFPANVFLAQEYSCDPGLLVGMVLGVLTFMCYLNISNKGSNYYWDVLFNYIAVGLIDAFVIIISKKIWNNINKFHEFDGSIKDTADSRVLYLSAILGYFPHYTTVIISAIITLSSGLETIKASFLNKEGKQSFIANVYLIALFMLLRGILNLISPIYQASVISNMHRYKRKWYRTDADMQASEKDAVLSAARLKQYLLLLAMINVSLWASDSFVLLKADMGSLYLLSYEHLGVMFFIITSLCVPIKIFYRIHTAAMSLNIWLMFTPSLKKVGVVERLPPED